MIDPSRHYSLFSPHEWGKKRIDVLGLRGTGSDLALGLAKLGVQNLHVWDDGVVEENELGESAFGRQHVNLPRVEAMKQVIAALTGTEVTVHHEGPGTKKLLGPVVFLAYPDMDGRKEAWKKNLRLNVKLEVVFEPRPGFDTQRIFTVDPKAPAQVRAWEAALEEFPRSGGFDEILSAACQWSFIRWTKNAVDDPPVFEREIKAPFPNGLRVIEAPAADDRVLTTIGAGAVGSRMVRAQARAGWKQLVAYDFDVVSPVNVANQAFGVSHIRMSKVEALRSLIFDDTGIEIQAVNEKVDGSQAVTGCVFLAVDTMAARRHIFDTSIQGNSLCTRVIEVRMGVREFRVFNFDPNDPAQVVEWKKSLTTDDPNLVERSPCGMPISIGPTAQLLSAFAMWSFNRSLRENDVPFSLTFKTQSMVGIERKLAGSIVEV